MTAFQSLAGANPHYPGGGQSLDSGQDAVEHYFECITTCSLDDGACVTACVEALRENP